VHCRRIEFVQRAVEEPRLIAGPGRIFQQPDGTIRVTAYLEAFDRVRQADPPVGTGVPPDRYWDLTSEEQGGRRRWRSERVHLDVDDFHVPSWRPIDVPLQSVRREEEITRAADGAHFAGYIFRSLPIDANARTDRTITRPDGRSESGRWNILRFPIGEIQVDIRQEDDPEYSVIDVASPGPLPPRFEQRLLETVRFVFGRPVSWSATVHTAESRVVTTLRGRPVHDLAPHFGQPIPHNVMGARDWMSELLRCYYLHVSRSSDGRWHPLSIWWSEVLRAGSREMESLVLVAAIAVEGVCKAIINAGEMPAGIEAISGEISEEWRGRVARELERLNCPERIRNRIDGLFPRMSQIGAGDELHALRRVGAVDRGLVQLWRDVRNDVAHGAGGRWDSASRITGDADGLVTLLRQLTFWWIGYRGWYQSLDPDGWRMRQYPAPEGGR